MKLSEYKNEDALDLLADLMEPATELLADEELRKVFKEKSRLEAIKHAIKNHKRAVLEILARIDGKSVDEYECNVLTIPIKAIEIINDRDLIDFFRSQGQNEDESSFGPAMENIVGTARR